MMAVRGDLLGAGRFDGDVVQRTTVPSPGDGNDQRVRPEASNTALLTVGLGMRSRWEERRGWNFWLFRSPHLHSVIVMVSIILRWSQ